jgi:dTDP-4-dehydrorhamnose reductase
MKNKVLIIGNGLLGTELSRQTGWDIISREVDGFDITDKETYYLMTEIFHGVAQAMTYDTIVNCVANTDTYSNDKQSHWDVNYKGTADLVDFCNRWSVKLVHISTDYVYANSDDLASEESVPVHCNNWYGYTKLLSDGHVQLKSDDYMLIRCTHKPTPFQYEKAWIDQVGNFDYVNNIASIITKLIKKDCKGVYNVGTDLKTMYELSTKTRDNVTPICKPSHVPNNLSMDLTKMKDSL